MLDGKLHFVPCLSSFKMTDFAVEYYVLFAYLSFGSLFHIIPQNQIIAVPQPNASIISLIRVVGAWNEATPTKDRTRQKAKP